MSALVGHPPANERDRYVVKALGLLAGQSTMNPNKGFPLGPKNPNLKNHDSHGSSIIVNTSIAMAFVILITAARLMVRNFSRSLKFGWDDVIIIPAAIFAVASLANTIAKVKHACVGQHIWNCSYENIQNYYLLGALNETWFACATCFTQMSICVFNMRLTGISSRKWMFAHYTFLGVVTAFWLTWIIINITTCIPVPVFYSLVQRAKHPNAVCVNRIKTSRFTAYTHSILDFMLLCVPIIVLSKVKMPWVTKIRLIFVFALGSVACAASVIRFSKQVKKSPDYTWDYGKSQLAWLTADLSIGVIVASLPTLNPLLDNILPKRWRASTSTASGSMYSDYDDRRSPNGTFHSNETASLEKAEKDSILELEVSTHRA